MANNLFHLHPTNSCEIVFGERLKAGTIIQPNDVYASTSGKWEKAPCPGLILQKNCNTYWVRPIDT